ncbi:hypothetical protein BH11PAT4_BH11PAT4_7960 [soil metagenome]
MATKGVEVSPAVLVGVVVVLLGMGVWAVMGSDFVKTDTVAVATPTPTVSPSATATPTPEATATPIPAVASGWVRYNLSAVGVTLDYPKTLSSVAVTDQDFAKLDGKVGTGHQVSGTLKVANSEDTAFSVSLLAESLDFTTDLGRGGSFTDFDGFEKSGSTFKTFSYNWEDGKKSALSDLSTKDTAEALTTVGGLEALIVTGGGVDDDGPGTLLKNQFAAIVMLPVKTGYHAVSLKTGTSKMTKADFTTLVTSFHLTK